MKSSEFVMFASKNSLPPTLHFSVRGELIKFCDNRFHEGKKLHSSINTMSAPTAIRQPEQPLGVQPETISHG
jgi:hypothetical protein